MENTHKKQLLIIPVLIAVLVGALLIFQKPDNESEPNASTSMYKKPLTKFNEREKLLTFGLFVTPNPDQNPIDPPERFTGYHTALDIETFEDEIDKDVEVKSICDGSVLEAKTADGYGGVLIHTCQINGEDVTILYGHLNPTSFTKKIGDAVKRGDKLGVLGKEMSAESGNTRKHLHLGIHKGPEIVLLGYVQSQEELQNYIDPAPLFE